MEIEDLRLKVVSRPEDQGTRFSVNSSSFSGSNCCRYERMNHILAMVKIGSSLTLNHERRDSHDSHSSRNRHSCGSPREPSTAEFSAFCQHPKPLYDVLHLYQQLPQLT
ncbi:hypothetical protein LIA77_11943 [Sarocladium implicatum]|nr:hypothetical protein LIA77_11943 [Sarocladium implicatum]